MIVATVAVAVLTGGADGESRGSAPSAAEPVTTDRVVIQDFRFMPPEISVPVGTEIRWTNMDSAAHTATSGTSPGPDGVFDTGTVEGGQAGSVTVRRRGTFAYFCEFHPFMTGTVTVE